MERRYTVQKQIVKAASILLPLLIIVLLPLYAKYISVLGQKMPACPFYRLFHLYCPACGNTRSIMALAQGDLLSSLRFNATPIVLLTVCVLFYAEGVLRLYGKRVRLFPRGAFGYVLIAVMLLYFFIRNFIPFLTP